MKPNDHYIKWLQAHPAVWEALQKEWEPKVANMGDWIWAEDKHVADPPCLASVLYTTDDFVGLRMKDASGAALPIEQVKWIPDLGQLVRMLQKEWSDWENRLEIWILKETAGNKGAKVALCPRERYLIPVESSKWEEEPEIACLALWAKVKGVE